MDYKKYADSWFEYVPPKTELRNQYSNSFDTWVETAPNIFDDIQYEQTYGKKDFAYVTGRVDAVISSPSMGAKLGDDYKNFIFSNSVDPVYVGKLFKWKNNYWIATNTNTYESVGNNCTVKRCNNMLRWIDENGDILSEPCALIETIKQSNDYNGDKLTTISGFTGLFCQRNANTNKIESNQRFLFGTKGNRKAFRVFGDGVKNYLNSETENDNSPSVIEFTIGGGFVYPDIDDLENGIANRYLDGFTLEIDEINFTDIVGTQKQLNAIVKKNGVITSAPLTWKSSDMETVTIDVDGNIELLKVGTATISCTLGSNSVATDGIIITVSDAKIDTFEIKITPDISGINEGDSQTIAVKLYQNDVETADVFTFEKIGSVPIGNYSLTVIDGNSFSILNNQAYYVSPLIIRCTSGIHTYDFTVDLNGAW